MKVLVTVALERGVLAGGLAFAAACSTPSEPGDAGPADHHVGADVVQPTDGGGTDSGGVDSSGDTDSGGDDVQSMPDVQTGPVDSGGGPMDAAPPNPCAGRMGRFCGGRLGMNPNTLYECSNGTISVAQACAGGACLQDDTNGDVCPCPSGNGAYCGQEVGGDAQTLYNCNNGRITPTANCVGTCHVSPPGVADTCGACPSGNGLYCGSGIGHDGNTLYNCNNGVLTVAQMCGQPCHVNPPGTPDTCGACPSDNGLYCGATVHADPNTLYNCNGGNLTVAQHCSTTCHVAPAGTADYCEGSGAVQCAYVQWWNSTITYGPYRLTNGGITWWDTDLGLSAGTRVQLRHDSQLIQHPVEAWGWQPRFRDMVTGQTFQFLHLQPAYQYTTTDGHVYPAGTVVGLSGGNTRDTGYPTYSTGSHLCVETVAEWRTAFPAGTDACH